MNKESYRERLEGPFKSAVTSLETIMSEKEAKKVKFKKEFDQKNQIFGEHLQKLIES